MIFAALTHGGFRALGMLVVGAIIAGAHNIARDAAAKSNSMLRTTLSTVGVVLALGILSAYTLGQVRDCSESDYLTIGCEVVDTVPVAHPQRWEAFFYITILLIIPALMGVREGFRKQSGVA